MGVVVPRTGSTLDPAGVEFVAAALARCHERMLSDVSLRDQAVAHDAQLARYLMSRADAGDRDVEALALRAVDRLSLAIRRKSGSS